MTQYDLTNMVKQAIVVRKDLKMKPGKIGAQVSHAAQQFIWREGATFRNDHAFELYLGDEAIRWLETGYRKILLAVNSEAELLAVHEAAEAVEAVVCGPRLRRLTGLSS